MLTPSESPKTNRSVLIVDDDDLSRAVVAIVLEAEQYRVDAVASGEEALALLASSPHLPELILTDLQMPGIAGNELAGKLRGLCGPSVRLLAMSGSDVVPAAVSAYDGFLRKPFAAEEVARAMTLTAKSERERSAADTGFTDPILDDATYAKLAGSMNHQQLARMYAICFADAAQRVKTMRLALQRRDDLTFRREAHTIKGGCGMLGALEMRRLAETMEESGLEARPTSELEALLDGFLAASERLQRILELQWWGESGQLEV